MARSPQFTPKYDKTRGEWVLNIPARYSSTGKRERKYWARGEEEKAVEHGRRMREGKEHFAERAKGISADLMEAAVKWEETVQELGYRNLDHFCREMVTKAESGAASPTLADLLNGHVDDHSKNWSDDYLSKRWKPFRKRFAAIETRRISEMDEEWWRQWLKTWAEGMGAGVGTYNQMLGMIRSLFERTAAKKIHPANPLASLPEMKERIKKTVPVSSPADVEKLLLAAWEHDREMVPYFATCYFAGPRPDSEAKELRFEHYDWAEKHLKVGVTKTNLSPTRWVPIEDALVEWMKPWAKKKGSIIPKNFTKRRHRLIYGYHTTPGASKSDKEEWKQLVPWGHDITRHTYGSMYEAAHRGEAGCRDAIVANMGHENFKTFKAYYLNSRPRSEGKAFWAIRPPKDSGNVIKIA